MLESTAESLVKLKVASGATKEASGAEARDARCALELGLHRARHDALPPEQVPGCSPARVAFDAGCLRTASSVAAQPSAPTAPQPLQPRKVPVPGPGPRSRAGAEVW